MRYLMTAEQIKRKRIKEQLEAPGDITLFDYRVVLSAISAESGPDRFG